MNALEQSVNNILKAIREAGQLEQVAAVLKKANRKLKSGKIVAPTSYAELMDEAYEDEFSLELDRIRNEE